MTPEEKKTKQREYNRKCMDKMCEGNGEKYQEYLRVKRDRQNAKRKMEKLEKMIDLISKEYENIGEENKQRLKKICLAG